MIRSKWVQYRIPFLLILCLGVIGFEQDGIGEEPTQERLVHALKALQQNPRGAKIIHQVLSHWKLGDVSDLLKRVQWGEASRTDTILTRRFNPKTGAEEQDRQMMIYLRSNQSQLELTLDLAHELVHAGARPSFDPYDPSLTPGKYILSAIEGEGGEVDAVVAECEVSRELESSTSGVISRCRNYLNHLSLSRDAVRRDFYRVGDWQNQIKQQLGKELQLFPLLSSESPKLYSSTGHSPYPIALFQEYLEITDLACQNSRKRLESLSSPDVPHALNLRASIQKFLQKRCHPSA